MLLPRVLKNLKKRKEKFGIDAMLELFICTMDLYRLDPSSPPFPLRFLSFFEGLFTQLLRARREGEKRDEKHYSTQAGHQFFVRCIGGIRASIAHLY